MYEIKKNIQLPPRLNRVNYPFESMEVWDMFKFPFSKYTTISSYSSLVWRKGK